MTRSPRICTGCWPGTARTWLPGQRGQRRWRMALCGMWANGGRLGAALHLDGALLPGGSAGAAAADCAHGPGAGGRRDGGRGGRRSGPPAAVWVQAGLPLSRGSIAGCGAGPEAWSAASPPHRAADLGTATRGHRGKTGREEHRAAAPARHHRDGLVLTSAIYLKGRLGPDIFPAPGPADAPFSSRTGWRPDRAKMTGRRLGASTCAVRDIKAVACRTGRRLAMAIALAPRPGHSLLARAGGQRPARPAGRHASGTRQLASEVPARKPPTTVAAAAVWAAQAAITASRTSPASPSAARLLVDAGPRTRPSDVDEAGH